MNREQGVSNMKEKILRATDAVLGSLGLIREKRIERRLEVAREKEADRVNSYWKLEFDKLTKKHENSIQELKEDFYSEATRKDKTHLENLEFESKLYQNEILKKEEEVKALKMQIKKIQDTGVRADKMIKGAEILIRDCVREVQNMHDEDSKKVQKFLSLAQRLEFIKVDLITDDILVR